MAVEDLLASLAETARFMEEYGIEVWASRLRDHEREIAEAHRDGKVRRIRGQVKKLKNYFGGMGSLNDIAVSDWHGNVDSHLSEDTADKRLDELLDHMFMWCLFWKYDREAALKTYRKLLEQNAHAPPPRVRHAFGR